MKRNRSILLTICLVLPMLFVASCAGRSKAGFQGSECHSRIDDAIEAYERQREGNAIKILDDLKFHCGGLDMMDTVHYYLGMSHKSLKQHVDARIEFERLRREHPFSPFAAEAHFRIGEILYSQSNPPDRDQTQTIEAIRVLNEFLSLYPSSEFADSATTFRDNGVDKLAEKEYLNARFYRRQGKKEASLVYYNSLIAKYASTSHATNGLVGKAEVLIELGRHREAAETLEQLQGIELDEELSRRVQIMNTVLSDRS